jgi:hypothetical protein
MYKEPWLMGTSYSEQSKVRSAPLKSSNSVEQEYNRVGLALAIFAALCLFCALWGLNGYFTARTVRNAAYSLFLVSLSWGIGWLVHIIVSLIEHHLWRLREALGNTPRFVLVGVYALIIVVGVLDVLTSTLAFLLLFDSLGLSVLDPSVRVMSTIFAEIIAIIPEPTIVWLVVALWRILRD